ncbi:transcription antitermination factor NusB [Candidatus Magnetominusculus xianensis]|uniref:Transcription antitermination protein NusB n=1 Tax=Candidatus Magnetominusculus xianensis TaxID=1748249 RepID=A0ABR5SGV0_9BACT|nr:transcription antitermination factor NusB [Candidatus Magnetominusculus xianensis]KWT90919.1 N utilization substance protein B [Candidatus Magnetominusculus xianensis]MBF0403074.1 transcription antitermination factor NusB [Nitrospirota bacterium]
MTRRQAREYVLQSLFQYEFTKSISDRKEIQEGLANKSPSDDILEFIEDLIGGVIKNLKEIDEIIQSVSKHWELQRIASVDRNIIRFAVYELLYRADIPAAVTINEAVDIAKKYSTLESFSFINGILDTIAHENAPENAKGGKRQKESTK